MITYIFTKRANFPVTGEERENLGRLKTRAITVLELIVGIGLLSYTFSNMNIWLFSVGLSLLIAPLIQYRYWNTTFVRGLLYLPFIITVAIVILISYSLIGG